MGHGAAGSPPGLEANGSSHEEALEAVKRAILQEMDIKVGDKVDELWARGKQMMGQVTKKHQEGADRLSAEIARCLDRQRQLEAENEQLKQLLNHLSTRLALLTTALSSMPVPGAAAASGSCALSPRTATTATTPAMTPPTAHTQRSGSDFYSPGSTGGAGTAAADAGLPEIPAFPFPSASTATPLSLAEALGQRSPQPGAGATQPLALSLADSLPLEAAAPFGGCGASPYVFTFTLRKADQTDLGLNVTHHERDKVLCIEGVRPDGAVDAWNRQCLGGTNPEKAVMPGDRILSVNNAVYDPSKMLEECKGKQLLRLTLFRGPADAPLPDLPGAQVAERSPPSRQTWLRADASEFVPGAASAAAVAASAAAAGAPGEAATSEASAGAAGAGLHQ